MLGNRICSKLKLSRAYNNEWKKKTQEVYTLNDLLQIQGRSYIHFCEKSIICKSVIYSTSFTLQYTLKAFHMV